MHKIIFILLIFSLLVPSSYAQTKNPTIPSNDQLEKINAKVDELKTKVASRVAELRLVEKRGTVGIVESVSDTQITISDINDKNRIIEVDEFTKFSSNDNEEFGISDIKKGSKISALGLYNKESQRLLARFVNEISIPTFIHGVISEKNDEEFTITVSTEDRKNFIVDVERLTKTFSYNETELDDSGFSRIPTGVNILVSGFPDADDENRITASRIVVVPDVPKNPRIRVSVSEESPTPSETPDSNEASN
jgi:hypothetical protein